MKRTNKANQAAVAGLLSFVITASSPAFFQDDTSTPVILSPLPATSEPPQNYVVFATNSVFLEQNADVLSGSVGVNDESPGPVLDSQVELTVGMEVTTPPGFVLQADRLRVKSGAQVASDVFCNELTNSGSITGNFTLSLDLPLFSSLPPFHAAPAGTQYIEVANDDSIALAAGDYGDIVVKAGGKILFTGGIYNLRSIDSRDNTALLFAASSEVRVADKFDSDLQVFIGPAQNASIDASDIIFYVAGINGASGNLGATPKAAQIGISNTVLANFYVPNGTLWLRQNTTATGAFWGKDVDVGIGVQVDLDNGIVPVDNTPPMLTVIAPVDGSTTSDEVIPISGTVVDATPVTLTVNGDAVPIGTNGAFSGSVALVVGHNTIAFVATDAAGNSTTVTRLVTRIDLNLPPDPATVAPPLDNTVATTLQAATEFLYTGANPIQTGVAAGTIDPVRVSVLRGKVLTRADQPLPGVQITILNHPEFGQTLSRADGMFDLAVNGGGYLTLNYAKESYLAAQRQINAPWQDYVMMDDVVMIALDPLVTNIDFSDSIEVALASVSNDADGTRRATLMFKQGTQASMVLADGTTQPLTSLNVRATEYTVGATGPMAMPAELPPTSAYTYCVELSADEAIQAGAKQVQFSQPVPFYVENFLNFSVGTDVPVGWYDREKGVWVPSDNGRVVKMLGTSNGLANLDLDGDNLADDSTAYVALGVNNAERARLATLYVSGQSLWRVAITHFTPWDCNWPYGPPDDAVAPNQPDPINRDNVIDNSCSTDGSIIGIQNQSLGEAVPVIGTGMTLHYQSDRMPGRRAMLEIPLSGSTIPAILKRIELRVSVAGREFVFQFSPASNLTYNFIWDRKDVYGRILQGRQQVSIRIGYVYDAVYRTASQLEQSFAQFGNALTPNQARQEVIIWQRSFAQMGEWIKPPHFAGWSLNVHRAYEPTTRVLIVGDGSRQSANLLDPVILTILNTFQVGIPLNSVTDLLIAPDGSIYFSGACGVYRFGPGSTITRIAGTGTAVQCGFSGDGGPATQAMLWLPQGIALSPDGNLYIADAANSRVRKVNPDGIITTIAGTGQTDFSGEGGPATAASLSPSDIALGPDGSLYIADDLNSRVLRIGTDGIITTVAGTGVPGYSGDGGLATQAQLGESIENLEVGRDGSIYLSDQYNNRVRKVRPDGIITTIAGVGTFGFSGDGGPATSAQLNFPGPLAVGPDGSLYIYDRFNHRIRRVSPDGIINTVAGNGQEGLGGDNGPALAAQIGRRAWLAIGPDGSLYHTSELFGQFGGIGGVIRLVTPPLPGNSQIEFGIASEDGSEIYTLSLAGKHLRTLDALTGVKKYEFGYDAAGRLIEIIDIDSLITTIERDTAGNPTAIVSPFGQRTTLTLDANGYLASVTNPNSETLQFTYTADGLMTSMTDAKGNLYRYTYDAAGLLIRDEDPAGGFKTLARTNLPNGYEVTLATAEGQSSRYRVEKLSTGYMRHTTIDASGLATVTTNKLDGTTITTTPDGTVTTRVSGPDPRFGMEAPLIKSLTVQTPAGLQSTMSQSRVITQMSGQTVTGHIDSVKINGRIYRTIYDGNLKQFTNISPEGRQTVTRVDNKGRVIEETVTGVNPIAYTYDPQGRLIETLQGDRKSTFTYDALSRLASATDPLLRTTTFVYDSVGRITQQVRPGARTISYLYDANGNLTSLTPPGKPSHSFGYTAVDLTERYKPPLLNGDSTVTRYLYDLDRRIRNTIRPDSIAVSVFYDTLGCGTCRSASRPKTIIFDRGTLNFAYDSATGLLDSLSAPEGNVLTYNYDGTLPKQVTWSGEVQGNVEVTYDNNFRVTSQKVNDGNDVNFQYDQDGLLTAAGGFAIARDPQNGRITGTTLGSITNGQSYNSFGELKSFHALFNSDTLFKTVYVQDSLGRITEITETIQGQTRKLSYVYDQAGRLAEMSRNDTLLAIYEYDANGNRLNHYTPSATITGTYDSQDRLLTYGNASYSYTRNGELLTKVVGTDTTRYTYDALGNLVSVRLPNRTIIEYVLDGQNRRVGKKVNGSLVKRWLYGNQLNIVAELDGAGNLVSRFVYGTRVNVPDFIMRGGVTYRIISDPLGSVRLVVNTASGAVVQRMDYDEFGNITTDTNPGFQPFGFAGGIYDEHTKLVRFMKRDYDAETGRWTAKDPIGFEGGQTSLYVYVDNDPVNSTDPTGLGKICNRSGQNLRVVAGEEGETPENAMVIGDNAMTPDGTDWDFVEYNGQWIKIPDGVLLVIPKEKNAPLIALYQAWYYRIPFVKGLAYWAGKSVRPADSSYKKGEVQWANDILKNVTDRRKAEGKELEVVRTPCDCQ